MSVEGCWGVLGSVVECVVACDEMKCDGWSPQLQKVTSTPKIHIIPKKSKKVKKVKKNPKKFRDLEKNVFFYLIMENKQIFLLNNVVSYLNREYFSYTSFSCQMSPLSLKSGSKIAIFQDQKYFLKNLRHLNIFGNCHCVTFLQY